MRSSGLRVGEQTKSVDHARLLLEKATLARRDLLEAREITDLHRPQRLCVRLSKALARDAQFVHQALAFVAPVHGIAISHAAGLGESWLGWSYAAPHSLRGWLGSRRRAARANVSSAIPNITINADSFMGSGLSEQGARHDKFRRKTRSCSLLALSHLARWPPRLRDSRASNHWSVVDKALELGLVGDLSEEMRRNLEARFRLRVWPERGVTA